MFSAFFAAYAVLLGENAGRPTGSQIFDLRNTAVETACLLISSFTCGMASVAVDARRRGWFYAAVGTAVVAAVGVTVYELTVAPPDKVTGGVSVR